VRRVGSTYSFSALTRTSGNAYVEGTTIGETGGVRPRRAAHLWCDRGAFPPKRRGSTGTAGFWTQQPRRARVPGPRAGHARNRSVRAAHARATVHMLHTQGLSRSPQTVPTNTEAADQTCWSTACAYARGARNHDEMVAAVQCGLPAARLRARRETPEPSRITTTGDG
jgi:hypothetical protein